MSAIPLVNLIPQGQQEASGNTVIEAGQSHPSSDRFENLIAQAGQQPLNTTSSAQASSGQEPTGGFSDLLKLLDILFGFGNMKNSDGLSAPGNSGESVPVQAASQDNTAGQAQSAASAPPKAFEGFLSEVQKMLVIFQAVAHQFFSGLHSSIQPLEDETSTLEEETSSENTVSAGIQQVENSSKAVQDATVPLENIQAAPGISLTPQPEIQQTTGTADSQPQTNQAQNFKFYSLSYSGPVPEGDAQSANINSYAASSVIPDFNQAIETTEDSLSNFMQMDMRQAVFSEVPGQDAETRISMMSGSIQLTGEKDPPVSLHMERVNVTSHKGSLNAYAIQASADTRVQGPASQQQGQASDNQNSLVINYASFSTTNQMDNDTGQSSQQQQSSPQGELDIVYQNTSQPGAAQVSGAETRFIQPSGTTGENVAAQLADGISQAVKLNRNRAVLHLNPPELGSVKVNISVDHANHIQASFVADHPETKHILEANLQHLRDNLAQNGFSLGQVNVDIGGNNFAGFGQDPQGHHLTPFGDPAMWLNNNAENSADTAASASGHVIDQNGVHVVI